jgi:GNAT superfamily N-acetyltransferase
VSSLAVRPFQRSDRDALTGLVNAHVAAVIPGVTVSVNAVMSQLEREPAEGVLDPWVVERRSLVAVSGGAVAAGALLHRYGAGYEVGKSYRNAAEIRWLVFGPKADAAGDALMEECLATMDRWEVERQYAGGELPAVAVYGVPETWPHVRALYVRHGLVRRGVLEIVLVAAVDDLPSATAPPLPGLTLRRSVGAAGTRFSAILDGEVVGEIEVELRSQGDLRDRRFGWSDIGTLQVNEELRRHGIGSWLLGAAADWLRLGGVQRLLTYAWPEEEASLGFAAHHGFRELVRTERGWVREA